MGRSSLFKQLYRLSGGTGVRNLSASSSWNQAAEAEMPSTGYNFNVTPEQQEYLDLAEQFTKNEIIPNAAHFDQTGEYPWEILKKAHETGLMNLHIPQEYGGMGLGTMDGCLITEKMAYGCTGIMTAIEANGLGSMPVMIAGNHEQKTKYLGRLIDEPLMCAYGVTEPGAGSDVAGIKTKAEKKGDEWVINGQKMWITNAFQADWICLLANTEEGPAHLNKSLICVPMDTPGIHLAKRIDKMGMRGSDTAVIYLDDVRVPAKNIIGDAGMGFTYQMLQFQEERLACAALTITPMDLIITETIEYLRQRKAFGQPLLNNQYVHFRLAELMTEVEMLRSGLYRATDQHVAGEDVTQLASMCKLKCGRLVREVADSCLQYWGGMGFTNEVLVSRLYRDLRLTSIGGGADEVMLGIICKTMGILPKPQKNKK